MLNEDTFVLMSLIEDDQPLYQQCAEFARRDVNAVWLMRWRRRSRLANLVSAESLDGIRDAVSTDDNAEVQEHLAAASVDWRDVAREFVADVLAESQPR